MCARLMHKNPFLCVLNVNKVCLNGLSGMTWFFFCMCMQCVCVCAHTVSWLQRIVLLMVWQWQSTDRAAREIDVLVLQGWTEVQATAWRACKWITSLGLSIPSHCHMKPHVQASHYPLPEPREAEQCERWSVNKCHIVITSFNRALRLLWRVLEQWFHGDLSWFLLSFLSIFMYFWRKKYMKISAINENVRNKREGFLQIDSFLFYFTFIS